MMEEWKDIEGFEGCYKVSNCGRVKSLPRIIEQCNGKRLTVKGMILNPRINQKGYYEVKLSINGKSKYYKVHRLVANAFIQNPKGFRDVIHKNQDKRKNEVGNLQWMNRSYSNNEICLIKNCVEMPYSQNLCKKHYENCLYHRRKGRYKGFDEYVMDKNELTIDNNTKKIIDKECNLKYVTC